MKQVPSLPSTHLSHSQSTSAQHTCTVRVMVLCVCFRGNIIISKGEKLMGRSTSPHAAARAGWPKYDFHSPSPIVLPNAQFLCTRSHAHIEWLPDIAF